MLSGKKSKHSSAKRGRSIDGIVVGGSKLGVPTARPFHPHQDAPADSIGSGLHRAEGFHPMRSGSGSLGVTAMGAEANLMLDEPIILDDQPASEKTKNQSKKRLPRLTLKRAVLFFLAVILAGGVYFGAKLYITERQLFRGGGGAPGLAENIDISKLQKEGDSRVNALILGVGGPGHDGEDLTDTIMIVSIDPVNYQIALLSLPRDLWVKIAGNGSSKLNAAFAYGKQASKSKNLIEQERDGLVLLDKTLKPILGISNHYHAIINFKAFQEAVDAVGGVTFYVPEDLYDPTIAWENKYDPLIAKKGTQTFNGQRALLYAKSRETSTDFARSERQRLLMVALKDKVLSAGTLSNPIKVSQLLSSLGDNVYTDFSLNDIKRLQEIISKVQAGNISSLDLVTPPNDLLTTAGLDGLSIVRPKAGLYDYTDLQKYLRSALKDGLISKENASVAIYNATDEAGLATKYGQLLKSYGYNVTTVDSLPQANQALKTTVVDQNRGSAKYTRHYLEKRFATVAQNRLPSGLGITPPEGTKFVIILGEDAQKNPS